LKMDVASNWFPTLHLTHVHQSRDCGSVNPVAPTVQRDAHG
jgi:hypothetical protein